MTKINILALGFLLGPLAGLAFAQGAAANAPASGASPTSAQAPAPDPASQRRNKLRSDLQKHKPAPDEGLFANAGNRHLSAQEREEMRQQLRRQREAAAKQ